VITEAEAEQALSEEAAVESERMKGLLLRFWDLPASERRNIALRLSLLEEGDKELRDFDRYGKVLIEAGADEWIWRAYGMSAQGGEYDSTDPAAPKSQEARDLRELDRPSDRIKLTPNEGVPNDLTAPLAWLMGQPERRN
jgi:hypothetical protein